MRINVIKKDTGEIIQSFENVIEFSEKTVTVPAGRGKLTVNYGDDHQVVSADSTEEIINEAGSNN